MRKRGTSIELWAKIIQIRGSERVHMNSDKFVYQYISMQEGGEEEEKHTLTVDLTIFYADSDRGAHGICEKRRICVERNLYL